MLKIVDGRTTPYGTFKKKFALCSCVFSECYVCFASFDLVCYEFDNCV